MVTPNIFELGQSCGGAYRIVQLHARTKTTESYVALHERARSTVVLTCSRLEQRKPGSHTDKEFLAEVAKLKQLDIDGAPRVINGGIDKGVYWIAREHVNDAAPMADLLSANAQSSHIFENLRRLIQRSSLVMRAALALIMATEVSDTLEQFAKRGIIHGALDPRTTLAFRGKGTPLVLDVGYAKLFDEGSPLEPPTIPEFRAPEQVMRGESDWRSDMYSLAASIYWFITGRAPEIGQQPTPLVDASGAALSTYSATILRAMEVDPSKRFPSWDAFYEAFVELREALLAAGEAKLQAERARPPAAPARAEGSASAEGPASGLRRSPTVQGETFEPQSKLDDIQAFAPKPWEAPIAPPTAAAARPMFSGQKALPPTEREPATIPMEAPPAPASVSAPESEPAPVTAPGPVYIPASAWVTTPAPAFTPAHTSEYPTRLAPPPIPCSVSATGTEGRPVNAERRNTHRLLSPGMLRSLWAPAGVAAMLTLAIHGLLSLSSMRRVPEALPALRTAPTVIIVPVVPEKVRDASGTVLHEPRGPRKADTPSATKARPSTTAPHVCPEWLVCSPD